MNVIFLFIIIPSFIILTIYSPENLISCFSSASNNALSLCVKLFAVYAIWMGFTNLIVSSGLINKFSKFFTPIIKKLFKTENKKTVNELSLNLTANLLGVGGISTPSAINAMELMEKENNEHGKNMLFIISSTSIQVIPLTVISLMGEYGANNPYAIFLPTLITTFLSTLFGIILGKVFK